MAEWLGSEPRNLDLWLAPDSARKLPRGSKSVPFEGSKISCGVAAVEFQLPTETSASPDLAGCVTDSIGRFGKQDHVPIPSMVAVAVEVGNAIRQHLSE